ncbi:MAG: UbiD family decarboxylase, partial [Nitrospinota bacterium]
GTDPAIIYVATAPLPLGVDELSLAGFINNRPVELTKCITIDLEVPKNAEIILEGYVDPSEKRIEGPFGDHTGYYSLADEYPIFHLTAITHRKNPIYVTTIVGKPPMEDCYMGKATERIFLPLLQKIHPEIIDYNLPWEGVFHNCVIVSIDKRYPAQAKKIMSALWGAGQMAFAKMILIVDSDINVADYNAVARRALSTINISSDLQLSKGILDVLDHSSPTANHGYKIGVDATRKFKEEIGVTPNNLDGDATLFSSIATKLDFVNSCTIPYTDLKNRLAIISIKKSEPLDGINFGKQLVDSDHDSINIFLILDSHVDSSDYSVALWKLFNNVDPKIDMIHYKNRLIIDATMKFKEEGHPREWPDEIVMDQDIVELVNRKWSKYNIGGK